MHLILSWEKDKKPLPTIPWHSPVNSCPQRNLHSNDFTHIIRCMIMLGVPGLTGCFYTAQWSMNHDSTTDNLWYSKNLLLHWFYMHYISLNLSTLMHGTHFILVYLVLYPRGPLVLKPMLKCVTRGFSNAPIPLKFMVVELHIWAFLWKSTLFWELLVTCVNIFSMSGQPGSISSVLLQGFKLPCLKQITN